MGKRYISILLAVALVMCLSLGAYAEGVQTISGARLEVNAGGTFDFPVSISNNDGIVCAYVTVEWPEDELTLLGIDFGSVMPDDGTLPYETGFNPGHYTVVLGDALATEEFTDNGVLFTLKFKANENASGVKIIELIPTYGDDGFLKFDLDPVKTEVVSGSVKINNADSPNIIAPNDKVEKPETFTDVSGHWSESFVYAAVEEGLFNGYPDGRFDPDGQITRAQFVTVLWRMEGKPNWAGSVPFNDAANLSDEVKTAIGWAYSNKLINGYDEQTFAPNDKLTREQAMKILFQLSGGAAGAEMMFYSVYDSYYADSNELHDWGKSGMYWGVYNEILSGTNNARLLPDGILTRGQAAKILTIYNKLG